MGGDLSVVWLGIWLRVSHKNTVKVLVEVAVLSRLKWEVIPFQGGCWQTSGPHWLMAGDTSSLSRGPLQGAAPTMAAGFHQREQARGQQRA